MVKIYAELIGLLIVNLLGKHRHRVGKSHLPILLILPALLLGNLAKAQDQIVKKDKSIMKVTVLEITDENVRYKLFDFPDGPIYNIKKADAFLIIYKNGRSESFATPVPSTAPESEALSVSEGTKLALPAKGRSTPSPSIVSSEISSVKTPDVAMLKKTNRQILGVGAYHHDYQDEDGSGPGLVLKVGAEALGVNRENGVATSQKKSGFGLGVTGIMGIYVKVNNEAVDFSKYYLSGYYFKEFDVKFISLGLLAGPGINYTTGVLSTIGSSTSKTDVSFFTGGLHTGQYIQYYLGKKEKEEKALFIRFGFDQFVMLEGALTSTMFLSLGF